MKRFMSVAGLGLAIAMVPAMSATAQTTVERPTQLDCLVGYPDGSFRGDRALTRYEFAAGMVACLNQQVQQLQTKKNGFATKQEVETLLQTQQSLTQEIQQLNERVRKLSDD